MKKTVLFALMAIVMFNLLPTFTYAAEKSNNDLIKIINSFLPPNATLVSPDEPKSTKPFQLYDFNEDGQAEMIVTFEMQAKEQPNPSKYGIIVLRKKTEGWEKIWETETEGVGLEYSSVADITGDGIKEYLFGVKIGASAGNILKIYTWNDNVLKMIEEVPYHRMELLNNQKVAIAVWQRYIADTYFVDVLKWNGEKLVLDEERYAEYYPTIENFYKDQILKTDAWFYWYTLADAQIKAKLFKEASDSIEKGITIAKQLSLPDVVDNFEKLREKIK